MIEKRAVILGNDVVAVQRSEASGVAVDQRDWFEEAVWDVLSFLNEPWLSIVVAVVAHRRRRLPCLCSRHS